MFPKVKPENLAQYFATQNLRLSKCLEPKMECQDAPIRAHSIGKSSAIALLEENGHVVNIQHFLAGGAQPKIEFGQIGRNNASTFTGLCSKHDADLFRPIDTRAFDPADKEQLFLFAYRAVTREVHAVMDGAAKIQATYSALVQKGEVPGDVPSPPGELATQHLLKAFMTWRYRQEFFDVPLLEKKFDVLTHDVITLEGQRPTIAGSSLFSLDWNEKKDDVTCVALNVLPTSQDTTVAIFSYAAPDAGPAKARLDRVLSAAGDYQKYELSRVILQHCENFVISPAFFNEWSDTKRETILAAFTSTVLGQGEFPESADLMLF
jgi:hypothetical protein